MRRNPYEVYRRSQVETASQAELVLMLYDGALKFVNIAHDAIEKGEIEKANTNIKKADDIIVELLSTLNHKYAVAEDFKNVYDYIRDRLLWANMKKDNDILKEAHDNIEIMRDTWKEVMRKTNNGQNLNVGEPAATE
ncbi:MAG: flagellar export chaperone FliS [Lachnospiraceae bacterium]|uniref:Flagellar secretion chaperone FliS n=1 Tax=Candidatus Weimeria bifida TaxID=2599074 RepID=A0A6N7J2F9_9FIRM|nr:flagellar export chaperone FliS [Candidatus Weimeria bifida]RRF97389.1 MAG: flagellar export chaperone FliS [Lachnospiraceae bacterium]